MNEEAFERALEALSRKERTVSEMVGWLAERGFELSQAAGHGAGARLAKAAGRVYDQSAALRRLKTHLVS